MYAYLREKNLEGVKAEFPARIFEQLRLNYVVVLDASGRKVFSRGFNLVAMESAKVPGDLDRITSNRDLCCWVIQATRSTQQGL